MWIMSHNVDSVTYIKHYQKIWIMSYRHKALSENMDYESQV